VKCKICENNLSGRRRKYCSEHCRLESKRITARKWNAVNKDKRRSHQEKWRTNNRTLDRANSMKSYYRKSAVQKQKDRLATNLRSRLRDAIKRNQKSGSAVRDLGCSIEFLKKHLEDQFTEGMSWSNYGRYGWHIDHIIPLDSFDLTNREELLKACNYTNLQPLWAGDNLRKGSKMQTKP